MTTEPEVSFILHEAYSQPPPAHIVFVHGALDGSMAYRKVVMQLSGYNTTVYDRRGYGASVGLGATTDLDAHAEDLRSLVGDEPAVVIGHSFGGLVSQLFAAAHPELVSALGLYESPVPGWDDTSLDDEERETIPPLDDPSALVAWFYEHYGDIAWEDVRPGAQRALEAAGPALAADMIAARSFEGSYDPAALAVPTVVAHGENGSTRQVARAVRLAEAIPGAQLIVVPEAGHPCHRTHPDAFVAFVEATVALG